MVVLRFLGLVVYDISQLPRALTFTCNIGTGGCGGYPANHLWSLSVEEQFYLIFPILMISLAGRRKAVLGVFLLLFPFGLLLLSVLKWNGLADYFSNFLCISAGVACAQYEPEIRKIFRRFPSWTPIMSFIVLLLVAAIVGPDRWSTIARYFFIPLLIVFSLMPTVFRTSPINTLLSAPWITMVGRSSYGIYLWQQLATAPFSGAGYSFYALSISACVGFSCLSYYFIERHLIGIGARLSEKVRSRGPAIRPRTAPT
jgi:peptidoglycan/LPS O-acetylase OafA/YrhL